MPMKAVEEESNQQIVLGEFTDECYGCLCSNAWRLDQITLPAGILEIPVFILGG